MDMSSKTRIVVLHLKELIYTGIFAVLGILFLLLLIIMFLPGKSQTPEGGGEESDRFVPGKYTTSVILGNSSIDVEVVVDANNINSIRLVNLDEAVTTMYPLMEPALNDLAVQICEQQSLEDISYSEDNKYTSQVLLEAISSALEKAEVTPGSSLEAPRSGDSSSEGNSSRGDSSRGNSSRGNSSRGNSSASGSSAGVETESTVPETSGTGTPGAGTSGTGTSDAGTSASQTSAGTDSAE